MKYRKKPKSSLVPLNLIVPCPAQPRKYFDEKRMELLKESVERYGLIHPITVRPINGGLYELIAGERRYRACEMAGFKEIEAVIVNADDDKAALMALSENLSRENLLFTERAGACVDLMDKYGFGREELSRELNISLSEITLYIRYFELPLFAQRLIREYELSDRHIALILRMENRDRQVEAVQKICLGNLDVKQSAQLIKAMKENRGRVKRSAPAVADERFLKSTVHKALEIIRKNGIDADMSETQSENGTEIKIVMKKPAAAVTE